MCETFSMQPDYDFRLFVTVAKTESRSWMGTTFGTRSINLQSITETRPTTANARRPTHIIICRCPAAELTPISAASVTTMNVTIHHARITNPQFSRKLRREYRVEACSSQIRDLAPGVGLRGGKNPGRRRHIRRTESPLPPDWTNRFIFRRFGSEHRVVHSNFGPHASGVGNGLVRSGPRHSPAGLCPFRRGRCRPIAPKALVDCVGCREGRSTDRGDGPSDDPPAHVQRTHRPCGAIRNG